MLSLWLKCYVCSRSMDISILQRTGLGISNCTESVSRRESFTRNCIGEEAERDEKGTEVWDVKECRTEMKDDLCEVPASEKQAGRKRTRPRPWERLCEHILKHILKHSNYFRWILKPPWQHIHQPNANMHGLNVQTLAPKVCSHVALKLRLVVRRYSMLWLPR